MKILSLIFSLSLLISCSFYKDDYEILNNLLQQKNIKVHNLSSEPYYFQEATSIFNPNIFYEVGFHSLKEKEYSIIVDKVINKVSDTSTCITRVSKPLFSDDASKILIAINEDCLYSKNVTIYLLYKNGDKWVIIDDINYNETLSK